MPNDQIATFEASEPTEWRGRYARIPGDNSVFHLKNRNGRLWPTVYWETPDGIGTCEACECDAASQLAVAVGAAKRKAGGSGGGSFVINEFGQVIVPASDGSERKYFVGELRGRLLFENAFEPNKQIDLGYSDNLRPGDFWPLPYVGIPHKLNVWGEICFRQESAEGQYTYYPQKQDLSIVQSLRRVRGASGCRFIVNCAGVILTKSPRNGCWRPVFIGRIDLNNWFEKESGHA
jgi:hypothetical protein